MRRQQRLDIGAGTLIVARTRIRRVSLIGVFVRVRIELEARSRYGALLEVVRPQPGQPSSL